MIAIGGGGGGGDNDYTVRALPVGPPSPLWHLARHWPGLNLVFCDGHVEMNQAVRLFERTEAARKRWNFDNEPHPESWRDKP
jgi:prepilin-type processing-associated H-X9-DG protein